ncbi:MAG: T9SS type A sorting domain-containing protein, partial [Bacteroidia bacterium]
PFGAPDPMFLVSYDLNGNVLCAQGLISGGDDQNSVSVSPSGGIYIGGDLLHTGTSPNPIIFGNDSLLLVGQENVFVAKVLPGNLCPDTITAVNEFENMNNFIVFPNPFNDNLIIKAKTDRQLEIILYDILSRKLLQRNFTSTTTINTEQLASGLYIYEVRNKNGIIANGKVIKQ